MIRTGYYFQEVSEGIDTVLSHQRARMERLLKYRNEPIDHVKLMAVFAVLKEEFGTPFLVDEVMNMLNAYPMARADIHHSGAGNVVDIIKDAVSYFYLGVRWPVYGQIRNATDEANFKASLLYAIERTRIKQE